MKLKKLEKIEHSYVTKLVTDTRQMMITQFNRKIHEFERQYRSEAVTFAEAEEWLNQLKQALDFFDDQIKISLNINEVEMRYNLFKKKGRDK